MSRISLAFRSFFAILFGKGLPADVAGEFGFIPRSEAKPAPAPKAAPEIRASDGALQMLAILQRDARLIDFLMEDIAGYSDDQVGAAVRSLHEQSRTALARYVTLASGDRRCRTHRHRVDSGDPNSVKLLGNVPANGKATQGILRHKGWRVERVELPKLTPAQNVTVLAPAEMEIE